MQKMLLLVESLMILVLLSVVVWQRYAAGSGAGGQTGEPNRNAPGICGHARRTIARIAGGWQSK
ncbi:MAG: hypothetical protein GYB65_09440 [Chloroflexi bacterium]|nr:hypothetical protein [Chloroflexota bacterium]